MTEDVDKRLDAIEARVSATQEDFKERENNLFRALKTFFIDIGEYQSGARSDFPRAAMLGLVFAYMKPRMVLMFGGMFAVFLGLLQVWILIKQNELLEQQNTFLETQTDANKIEAVSVITEKLGDEDISQSNLQAIITYTPLAFDTLTQIAGTNTVDGMNTRRALASAIERLSTTDAIDVINNQLDWYSRRLIHIISTQFYSIAEEQKKTNEDAQNVIIFAERARSLSFDTLEIFQMMGFDYVYGSGEDLGLYFYKESNWLKSGTKYPNKWGALLEDEAVKNDLRKELDGILALSRSVGNANSSNSQLITEGYHSDLYKDKIGTTKKLIEFISLVWNASGIEKGTEIKGVKTDEKYNTIEDHFYAIDTSMHNMMRYLFP